MKHPGAWLCVVVWLLAGVAAPAKQQQPPVFRTASSAVAVNVSVKSGNRPVVGLTAKDFVLTDGGVSQTVLQVSFESVPIDVALVLDASGSAKYSWRDSLDDARRIIALLRPIDRVRVLAFDRTVREIVALQPASAATLKDAELGNTSAVYQALAAALIARTEPGRRRFIVAITDAHENSSALELRHVQALAARSDAVLSIILDTPALPIGSTFTRPRAPLYAEAPVEALEESAKTTGGDLKSGDPVDTFKDLFADFRDSYVLHFVPAGVPGAGWHELDVKVPGPKRYDVRFRRGYFGG